MRTVLLALAILLLAPKAFAQSADQPPGGPEEPPAHEASPVDRLTGGNPLHGMKGADEHKRKDFSEDSAVDLKKGDDALEDHNYEDAARYFEYVRTHFPFQDAAKTAELRLADTDFAREDYESARDRYDSFIKAHPANPKVDYAAYRSALTHFEERPSEFFLLPPQYEKDLTEVRAAYDAMKSFLQAYPNSRYQPLAKKVVARCEQLLAQRELYVAQFYARRNRWAGVAGRLEGLVKSYPDSALAPKALLQLSGAYRHLKQPKKAEEALRRVIQRYPDTGAAKKAKQLLGS